MGARRFELRTSSLSGTRSNQLSYAPYSHIAFEVHDLRFKDVRRAESKRPGPTRAMIRRVAPALEASHQHAAITPEEYHKLPPGWQEGGKELPPIPRVSSFHRTRRFNCIGPGGLFRLLSATISSRPAVARDVYLTGLHRFSRKNGRQTRRHSSKVTAYRSARFTPIWGCTLASGKAIRLTLPPLGSHVRPENSDQFSGFCQPNALAPGSGGGYSSARRWSGTRRHLSLLFSY